MIESASLPAAERSKREIERLRKDAAVHPDDPELQLRLASLLLADGQIDAAEAEFRVLLTRNADSRTWQQAGSFLLGFERYPLARDFLERAAAGNPASNLDLAIAVFFLDGPAKALSILEQVPAQQRSGDYLLLKAKILDAAGQSGESEKVLEQGLQLSISRPQIAREAGLLLVRHDRKELALEFLTKTAGSDPDLLLTRAMVLALTERNNAAEQALNEIESQWPEWDRPYVVHGVLLEKAGRIRPRAAPWPDWPLVRAPTLHVRVPAGSMICCSRGVPSRSHAVRDDLRPAGLVIHVIQAHQQFQLLYFRVWIDPTAA